MLDAARLIMVEGYDIADAACAVDVTIRTIQNYVNDPAWQAACDSVLSARYAQIAGKAIGVIEHALDQKDATTARWAAEKLLPRLNAVQSVRDKAVQSASAFNAPEDDNGNALSKDEFANQPIEALLEARRKLTGDKK